MIRRLLSVLPLLGIAHPALAQDGDLVVVGRGLAQRPGDRAFDVVTIDADRIAESASNRLDGVLADVAGLQQFRRLDSRSANPTSQGISLRGISGNASSRALLLLDGVPQADPFGGWVAFPAYATDRIGLIRVTRGGGSGYFGAGALAGTVEVESATPTAAAPLAGRVAYGSRASIDAQASAALVRGAGFATVSAAYAKGDGFVPVVADSRGPADRPSPYEQVSGAVRAVVAVAADTELQANVAAFTDRRERGTAFSRNRSDGADASVRVVGRGRWGYSALAYVQARSFASSIAAVNAARTVATRTLDQYNTPADGTGARLEIVPPVGAGRDLRIGADLRTATGRTQELYTYVDARPTRRRVAGGSSRSVGAFVDGSADIGALTLTLGGRIDRWRIGDGSLRETTIATGGTLTDTRFADRTGTEWTGRAGAAWTPVAPLTLRAAGYRGWRLPTLNELYRPFRAGADATAANAALAPERLVGIDGGVVIAPATGVSIAATLFWNRLDDAIANVTEGRGPAIFPGVGFVAAGGTYRIRRNLDAIRSRGVEVDARAALGRAYVQGSWSHVDPRVEASGIAAPLDGLRPAQTPTDMVSATVGWRRDGVAASATVRHVARQFEDDQNTRTLAPATTADAYLALPLARGIAVEARAENLFDARVEAGIAGTGIVERATPRTVWIGVRLGGG
ncbi:TonB-dependent receptor [Sphingomonas sp. Leaf412]|uniref:TonB-dependent receptor n=1 Tax=Sphingomonas sp. Leaf412 TaxID=1736370 RepID=UPI0006F7ADE1|nr:TonB-dependent receptor [Sphingomonas sp. Leaf412]KQT35239.1 TonB-dependent receptor [Sphingomonas sp. Leaf412]